jgi:ribosomal protein S18 acetylase RimI-like enzyme
MLTIETAIDVFVESFSFVYNLTQPCEVIHYGPLRIIKALPGQSGHTPRDEIVVPLEIAPDEVVAHVRAYQPTGKHVLDVFQRPGESLDALSAAYRQYGYEPGGYEPLMASELPAMFTPEHPHEVHRVRTQKEANLVVKNARQKLIRPEHLSEPSPPVRLYYVEDAGKVIAWGRSTIRHQSVAFVAGMSTNKAYRRRGIASAILSQILVDDAAQGASYSVLLSSRVGYALYRKCGYVQIGSLHMFVPR